MSSPDIKSHIREYYGRLHQREAGVAGASLPVKTGRELAKSLGYNRQLFDILPEDYWRSFLPCGNLSPYLQASPGDRMLNLGCGVGVDTFSILLDYGASIEVISLDVVFEALKKASLIDSSQFLSGMARFPAASWICGDAEALPFQEDSFDWVIMNGVFNLFTWGITASGSLPFLKEARRVVKPGGSLIVADLCSSAPLPDYFHENRDAWAWCMSGALTEEKLSDLLRISGFQRIRIIPQEEPDILYRIVFSCRKAA